jgi:hypothetical protein
MPSISGYGAVSDDTGQSEPNISRFGPNAASAAS